MKIGEMFSEFLNRLKVDNAEQISLRYGEITASLNKRFRDTDSKTANRLQVGSYGRWTAIKGISDLDMLYIMPASQWQTYRDDKQSQLLTDVKDAIKARYPKSRVRVDRLVVTVTYANFHVEVQPVFELDDGSFKYPDTYDGGSWKVTKPREEIAAMKEFVDQKNSNLRQLCKMSRAWKNKHGVVMGGLLVDTLAHNYLNSTSDYDDKGFTYYDWMARDFFGYLKNQPDRDHYKALGSGQNVKVKKQFQRKAKTAYNLCLKAIEAGETDAANDKWKRVFGRRFPAKPVQVEEAAAKAIQSWRDTEQYIEDHYPVDIRFNLTIDCDVYTDQSPRRSLLTMLLKGFGISSNRKLIFKITECAVPEPFIVKWKVLNRGEQAKKRDCIRGDIIDPNEHSNRRKETANFSGNHVVECYVVQNGVVVARDEIEVPIM